MSAKTLATFVVVLAVAGYPGPGPDVDTPTGRQTSAGILVVELPGIPGPYCAYGIQKRLRELSGVSRAVMDWDAQELRVWATKAVSTVDVAAAVEGSEYPYEYTVR